jgi:hypothetical protein
MTDNQVSNRSKRVYRVDKLVVPEHVRNEFFVKVRKTHEFLKRSFERFSYGVLTAICE